MNDTMIDPRDSAWFSTYNERGELLDVHDQSWFKNGGLGLLSLERKGKIHYLSLPGSHMSIPMDEFKVLADKYLASASAFQETRLIIQE
jgi:palmitoyl-protein thioesterase